MQRLRFFLIGESKRCWASRRVEHDPARAASKESTIQQHAEETAYTSTHAAAKFLKRMKLITSAEFLI